MPTLRPTTVATATIKATASFSGLWVYKDDHTDVRLLGALAKVKKVSHELSDDGWEHFSVLVDSGTDARERISKLCRQHNWPLRSLHRLHATLEDVFVELTRKD